MTGQRPEDAGDWGETDFDPAEREQAELNLDDPSSIDNEPWSPPTRQPRGAEYAEKPNAGQETIDERIIQEEPDPGTAYGRPDHAAELYAGGDDPDAIPVEQDVLGGDAEGLAASVGEGPEGSAVHLEQDPPR